MPITVGGTAIVFNDATTQTTAFTGGVTSLNGQTGAITNTGTNAIGSYVAAGVLAGGNATIAFGNTYAGSNLRHTSAPAGLATAFNLIDTNNTSNPSLSGTWRAMARSANGPDDGGYNMGTNLFVRIS